MDAKVYDVTKFKNLHPGGASVFLPEDIGKSRTMRMSLWLNVLFCGICFSNMFRRTTSRQYFTKRWTLSPSVSHHAHAI